MSPFAPRFLLPFLAALPLACPAADAVLRRNIERVPSLDPVQAQSVGASRAVALVYETLLEYDYAARPYRLRGCLAADLPEVSDNGLTLTFHLRPGILFGPDPCFGTNADGRPKSRELTANDVLYSLKRVADAKVGAGSWWILKGRIEGLDAFHAASAEADADYDAPVTGLQAPDKRTVRLRLTHPVPQLLWCLAMPPTAVVPREAVEFYGLEEFGQREVGTGPFRLVSWRRNYRMSFERRPGRDTTRDATPDLGDAAGCVPVERIEWPVMDDASTRWMAFLSGALDMEGNIPRDNLDSVLAPDGTLRPDLAHRGIRLLRQSGMDTFYIGLNMDDPVLGPNKALRQALNAAFDFAAWAAVNPGKGTPCVGPVPANVEGRLDAPFPYAHNEEKAKALLAEAGYPNGIDPATGRRLTLTLDLGQTDQETRESAELMASFFDRIGIVLEPRFNNWPAFLTKVRNRQAQMFQVGWIADYPDAENFLQLFYGPNASPSCNRVNYVNPAFDALYEEASRTLDADARHALYRRMQEIIREDCPWVFLYHRTETLLVHDRVRNFRPHDFPYGMEKHYRLKGAQSASH